MKDEITPWNDIFMFKGLMMFIATMSIEWNGDMEKVSAEMKKISGKKFFKKEARRLQTSQASLIRRVLDRYIDRNREGKCDGK
jgi:uncharacterized ferredoxin-like protein